MYVLSLQVHVAHKHELAYLSLLLTCKLYNYSSLPVTCMQSSHTCPHAWQHTCSSSILRAGSAATAASSAAISPSVSSNTSGRGTTSRLRCRLGTTTQHDCQLLLLLLLAAPPLLLLLLLVADTLPNRYSTSAQQQQYQ